MKILYTIHQFFPDYYTGTEVYLLNMAKMMKRFGHEVEIVTYHPTLTKKDSGVIHTKNLLIKEYVYQGIPVTAVRYTRDTKEPFFDYTQKDLYSFFVEKITAYNPDIVHITHLMRIGQVFQAARACKKKIVLTLTDYWIMCPRGGSFIRKSGIPCMSPEKGKNCAAYCFKKDRYPKLRERYTQGKTCMEEADAVIISAEFLKKLLDLNTLNTSRVSLIRHGFNYDAFKPIHSSKKSTHFTVASLGSPLPHKGVDLLIDAFKQIPFSNMRLEIYGTDVEKGYFNKIKNQAAPDKRISFEGKYTISDLPAMHKKIDLIVQPSRWYETYPLVGVTGLAFGVPLIVPDLTGSRELVAHGKNGYIFTFDDEVSLRNMISQAYQDRLKQNAFITYPYTIEGEAFETNKLYETIVYRS